MQVVCTATLAMGSRLMSDRKAAVTRLASIEEMAGMVVLCSDKTGTLTYGKFEVQKGNYWAPDKTEFKNILK